MMPFLRKNDPHALAVAMTTVKMADQLALIGCADGGRMGAIAAKVGLSGRAVNVVPDEASATRARKGAADAGALVDIEIAPPTRLPLEDNAFDLVVVDDTGGLFATMAADDRVAAIRETIRILRPRGRVMVIGAIPRGGLGAIFTRAPSGPPFDPTPSLKADGFKFVRVLAEREGMRFVEGLKA
jgi:SAM-dependent methyltransferase